ncbi:MAG: GGDEF domain-containing protein [Patescibacteria group bacterium]
MGEETIIKLKKRIKELEKLARSQETEIRELSALSDRDILTELYNRRGFVREAEKFLKEAGTLRKITEKRLISFKDFSVIFIDLDNFKIINNEYGHKAGDKALKMTAEILKYSVRDSDIVARWGGDEFVIGLAGADESRAFKTAEKLRKKLRTLKIDDKKLTASFGIVSYHQKGIANRFSPESSKKYENKEKILGQLYELIEKADMTMYEAKKKKGKSSIVIYNNKSIV